MSNVVKSFRVRGYVVRILQDESPEHPWDNRDTVADLWDIRRDGRRNLYTVRGTVKGQGGTCSGLRGAFWEIIRGSVDDDRLDTIEAYVLKHGKMLPGVPFLPFVPIEGLGGQGNDVAGAANDWRALVDAEAFAVLNPRRFAACCLPGDGRVYMGTRKERQTAGDAVKSECVELMAYLNGECYGFTINDPSNLSEDVTTDDDDDADVPAGELIERAWGFYGMDYCEEHARECVPDEPPAERHARKASEALAARGAT